MTESESDRLIQGALRLVRQHFAVDVAFVSHVTDEVRILRYVDAADPDGPVCAGLVDPADESYCSYVIDGRLPQFLRDPARHPVSAALEVTHRLPVGTHLSVPIVLSDSSVYGTLCAFSTSVRDDLEERDLGLLRMLAGMIAQHVEATAHGWQARDDRTSLLAHVAGTRDFEMHFQPIFDLADGSLVGVEALSRFPSLEEGPAGVFAAAWEVGVGVDLELAAVELALARMDDLPPGTFLAVNSAAATVADPRFRRLVQRHDADHIVVEITEHAVVNDYPRLRTACRHLRELGIRLAVDDVGAGFSGLRHILRLSPDVLKLDGALVEGVDRSADQQAMILALLTYATRTDTIVIAEGVETQQECETLQRLGIHHGQGYWLGRPADLDQVLAEVAGPSRSPAARTSG